VGIDFAFGLGKRRLDKTVNRYHRLIDSFPGFWLNDAVCRSSECCVKSANQGAVTYAGQGRCYSTVYSVSMFPGATPCR
jgi:hypothetical protein